MKFWRSLININAPDSSKSFTLVISALISAVVGICVCFVLCWDVIHNNYIKTDMESMGIFMLCMGGYLAGGSASKIFGDRKGSRAIQYMENMNDELNEEEDYTSNRKKNKKHSYRYGSTSGDTSNDGE